MASTSAHPPARARTCCRPLPLAACCGRVLLCGVQQWPQGVHWVAAAMQLLAAKQARSHRKRMGLGLPFARGAHRLQFAFKRSDAGATPDSPKLASISGLHISSNAHMQRLRDAFPCARPQSCSQQRSPVGTFAPLVSERLKWSGQVVEQTRELRVEPLGTQRGEAIRLHPCLWPWLAQATVCGYRMMLEPSSRPNSCPCICRLAGQAPEYGKALFRSAGQGGLRALLLNATKDNQPFPPIARGFF